MFFMTDRMVIMNDEQCMQEAIEEAKKARAMKEVPIGAVIVYQDEIIARGYNVRETTQETLSHAEVIDMKKANEHIGSWRLEDCTLYVTLEPCPMSAGEIVHSQLKAAGFSAKDAKEDACGTLMNLLDDTRINHQVESTGGVLGKVCSQMLTDFFKELRG